MASSIINCKISESSIVKSINTILKTNFKKKSLRQLKMFGNGDASEKITKKIGSFNFGRSDKKIFYDCLK